MTTHTQRVSVEMQISGSALSYSPVSPAVSPLSNDALHGLFRAGGKKGGNGCLF